MFMTSHFPDLARSFFSLSQDPMCGSYLMSKRKYEFAALSNLCRKNEKINKQVPIAEVLICHPKRKSPSAS
jgi:hypothetical protein